MNHSTSLECSSLDKSQFASVLSFEGFVTECEILENLKRIKKVEENPPPPKKKKRERIANEDQLEWKELSIKWKKTIQQNNREIPSEFVSLLQQTNQLEDACMGLELRNVEEEIIPLLCKQIIIPELSFQRNGILIRQILLPKVSSLQQAASRSLLNSIIETAKEHPKSILYSLVFPLLIHSDFGSSQNEIVNRLIKDCFSVDITLMMLE
eukprot:TRINITY_DN5946_c0_g1_i4.p1 TRINITY_DN5946_c0_g1~~TRINITY_DN5946_c0_g1_i4.p1  ORF type:complete len:210 (+),score=73.49 TRINITY_DN5946_c0_g1_i4:177-806(+)